MFKSMKQWPPLKNENLHKIVRCLLGLHGIIHIFEMFLNLYEGAVLSALLTAFSGSVMILGALIDMSHHQGEKNG
jgi:hypothetical protein